MDIRIGAAIGLLVMGLMLSLSGTARADSSVIKHPGHHPDYEWAIEPHAVVFPFDPPGRARAGGGAGARADIVLMENGFIKTINNSVAVSFGADLLFANGAGVWLPGALQWNFWLSRNWSVFAEPGVGIYLGKHSFGAPIFAVGGRFLFNDDIALVLRAGYPYITVGAAFHMD
jgi:hypothetical protein